MRVTRQISRRSPLLLVLVALLAGLMAITSSATYPANAAQVSQDTPEATPQPDLRGVEPLPLRGDRRATFEAYVADALERHGVPGAAVGVIQDGEVVYLQGFGVTELGGIQPVTPDTLMMIGSITKSMTSLMAATLVDDGWLTWDTPVVELLPEFAVNDPQLTRRLSIADAFCACTGIPRRDFELAFNFDSLDPATLIDSMDELPLTAPLGEQFQYSNQMYAVGGYAAAEASDASRQDLYQGYVAAMRERVLNPIRMPRSTFLLEDVLRSGDYALPHANNLTGTLEQVPVLLDQRFVDSVAPAGAMWSSAREMARYVQTQLQGGVAPNGQREVSEANLARTQAPRVATPPAPPELPPVLAEAGTHYGMGWVLGEWRGQPLVHHDGGTLGFAAEVAFMPEADLGIVILTNSTRGSLFYLDVEFRLYELLFDQEPEFGALVAQFMEAQAAQAAQLAAQLRPVDPEAIAPYLGSYEHPTLGEVKLTLQKGRLILDIGEMRSELRPLVDEAGQLAGYVFIDTPFANPSPVVFRQGDDGQPQIVVTFPSDNPEEPLVYVFTLVEPANDLTRCAGKVATITGTEGDDLINGTPGDDVIIGLGGNDTISGHGGNDTICGSNGDDVLHGGYGSDGVHGGPGDDWVAGGWGELDGTDWVSGGPGDDVVYGGDADDSLWGGGGQDLLYGGTGNDNLYGNHRQDLLRGGLGDDSLFGGEGDDSLDGGADADFCDGGAGSNTITACEIITPAVDLARVQRELDENLNKWNSLGLTDYRFVYQRICFCLPKVTKPVIIEVRDGAMTSVVVEATGEAVDPSEWATYRTIEGIFQLLQDAIDQRAHDITVEYDQQYGFSRSSYIDYDVRIADEEQRVYARDLEPIVPTN